MLGRAIRQVGQWFYTYPNITDISTGQGSFAKLKIALLADQFTTACLAAEANVKPLTLTNFNEVLTQWQPDLIFVESAFHGIDGSWRYELAKQPKWLRLRQPNTIFKLVNLAKKQGIPTVFWNKDDDAFFNAFIDVAKVFDFVFTTDINCVPLYKQHTQAAVHTLAIPYQPRFHFFDGFNFTKKEACFTGSYYRKILPARREFMDMLFAACNKAEVDLNIYDRNTGRFSHSLEFRYPKLQHLKLHNAVPHQQTAEVYKAHAVSVNVSSITASETMYSRRLLEILACGGIAVTNPSQAVNKYFKDYCHVVSNHEEAVETLARLSSGASKDDLERAQAGADYVKQEHTWAHRLEEVCALVKI